MNMMETSNFDILREWIELPLLKGLSEVELKRLLSDQRARIKDYPQDRILHIEGDPCRAIELILCGEIQIEQISDQGQLLVITRFLKGDLLGGNLIFSNSSTYPMTISVRKASQILSLEKSLVLDWMTGCRAFLLNFLEIISDNTSILSHKIRQTVHRSIRSQILEYVERQAIVQNSRKIRLTMSKRELAERFGIQRTSLSRELHKMKMDNLIDYDSQTITLMQ